MLSQEPSVVSPQFAIIGLNEISHLHDCNASELRTYLALAAHADDEGICWPGRRRLALITGQSKEHVSHATRSLEEMGLIEKEVNPYGRITYHLPLHRHRPCPDPVSDPAPPRCETTHPPVQTPAPQEQTSEQISRTEERQAEPAPVPEAPVAQELAAPLSQDVLRNAKTTAPDCTPESWIDAGKVLRPDLAEQVIRQSAEVFLDHARSKALMLADWLPAWRNWLRRERGPKVPQTPCKPASTEAPSRYANWGNGIAPISRALLTPEQVQERFEAGMVKYGAVKGEDGLWRRPSAETTPASSPPLPTAPVAPVVAAVREVSRLSQQETLRLAELAAAGVSLRELREVAALRGG